MVKKLKVWLNNKLNKYLHCTVVIKFYRIFVTELVFTFFVFRYENHFEFPKDGKRSPCSKILEIPGGRRGSHQRPPGIENPGWRGACKSFEESSLVGVWIFSGTTHFKLNRLWKKKGGSQEHSGRSLIQFYPTKPTLMQPLIN